MLVHWCVVIGSVRYQHWLLNNELGDTGEIDRDAGLITSLHSARMLLTINITITYSGPAQWGGHLTLDSNGHSDISIRNRSDKIV